MTKKISKEKKNAAGKVSYLYKPDNMTLEDWQVALRRQAASKGQFIVSEVGRKEYPGTYRVVNPETKMEYKVVYRGKNNTWNYCSCMDFKTSQLGTCKHLEAVRLWMEKNHRRICRNQPSYTSVYLSYLGERKICLHIGTDHQEEFMQMSAPYFDKEGVMRPEAVGSIMDFFREAAQLDDSFRCYPDALSFIVEKRDMLRREQFLRQSVTDEYLDSLLKTNLFPYQKEGIRFAFRVGKAIIADEMGLGKTIQAIGTAELMRKNFFVSSALIVCPTSLKYQWKKEIERFTDAGAVVVEGSHFQRKKLYAADEFYKIVSYNSLCNDLKILKTFRTDFLIMDEVQRLKNWNTQISRAARLVESEYTVILSGTPLENKLEELYSIVQFVDQYCLGPYYRFMDNTVVRSETGQVVSYKNLNTVGKQLENVLIRRRKKDVALQLPGRMDKILFVPMTEQQREMHDELQSIVAQLVYKWSKAHFLSEKDRRRLLLMLGQMRMLCDSTYILDQKSRYDTKVEEVMNILRTVFESGNEKVVIFSQWERMTRLVAAELDKMGIHYEYLHGGIPSKERKNLVDNFTYLPESRVFLSTDAGSTGLNLQVASMLINLDLPWNPAILEQRVARIYRIGQAKNIQVINMVASRTIEERMLSTLNFKSSLFEGILDGGEDSIFLENSRFDKIMDSIKVMAEPLDLDEENQAGSEIRMEDNEEDRKVEEAVDETSQPLVSEPEKEPEEELADSILSDSEEDSGQREEETPERLVSQGFAFFNNLARMLSSPEATRKLVDTLVEEDPETGQAQLRIPVPDKKSVAGILDMFGKLLAGGNR